MHRHEHCCDNEQCQNKKEYLVQDTCLAGAGTYTFVLENLDCPHCAAKIEQAVKELPQVTDANLIFALKKLQVQATIAGKDLTQLLQQTCDKIEDGVFVKTAEENAAAGKNEQNTEYLQDIAEIAVGAVVLISVAWLNLASQYQLYILAAVYLLLGWRIIIDAVKGLAKGQALDENFLMTIATLGSFVIGAYEEAVGVMLFFRIGEFFEEQAVAKSRNAIMEAVDLRPQQVNLLCEGKVQVIPAKEAKVGDILLVRVGDRIPLDGVIVDGSSLLDTSAVTGEPVPVSRHKGDEVTSGWVNTTAMLKIKVEKPLAESMVSKILEAVENAAANKPKIDKFITRFARIYTPVVVGCAAVVAVVPSLVTGQWQYWVYIALTFLVISCPCALVLSVPLAFFSGIGIASKNGILLKSGAVLESLKNIKIIAFDKTGTITEGSFKVKQLITQAGITAQELLFTAAKAEQVSSHPIAKSIMEKAAVKFTAPDNFEEYAGEGIAAYFGQKRILCGNSKLLDRFGIKYLQGVSDEIGTEVLVAENDCYLGKLLIADTIKNEAKETVAQLNKAKLTTAMLTGDITEQAQAVGKAVGIGKVYARLLPQDKLTCMEKLRQQGEVMFVGDGINDAPVLAGADVGAAMGSGSDAAVQAADVVLLKSQLKGALQAIKIGKLTGNIAWQNVIFAITVKVLIMLAGLCGYASMWAAVMADTGVAMICVLNSVRILYSKV